MIKAYSLLLLIFSLAACTQAPAPTVDRAPSAQAQAAGPGEYQVRRGDTLYRIARENGLDHRELAMLNNIDNPSNLREGQILRLRPTGPVTGGTPVAAVVSTVAPVVLAGGVETRPLDGEQVKVVTATPPANGTTVREPRGGKLSYSDEAHARLNAPAPAPVATTVPAAAVTPSVSAAGGGAASAPATDLAASANDAQTAVVEGVAWSWPTTARIRAPYNGGSNKGIDFSGKQGDPVLAAAEGKVLYVGDALPGFGKLVIVRHNKDLLSVYAHNSRILVKEGQSVKQSQKIAEKGSTGTDSVKLHFEIRKQGKPVDPTPYLPKR